MITGTLPGGTSTFKIGFLPPLPTPPPVFAYAPLQTGPTVTVDDPNVTLSAVAADGTFTATVAASDTGSQYNITVNGVNDKGAAVTHTFAVPILAEQPVSITDFTLDQVS